LNEVIEKYFSIAPPSTSKGNGISIFRGDEERHRTWSGSDGIKDSTKKCGFQYLSREITSLSLRVL